MTIDKIMFNAVEVPSEFMPQMIEYARQVAGMEFAPDSKSRTELCHQFNRTEPDYREIIVEGTWPNMIYTLNDFINTHPNTTEETNYRCVTEKLFRVEGETLVDNRYK